MSPGQARAAHTAAAPEPLLRHRETIDARLRAEVGRLPQSCVPAVAYHLCWCDIEGNELQTNGGKRVRPAIALPACEAAGSPAAAALPGAVALELVDDFSLVHDDIMDGDVLRRHRTTVWAKWGVAHAFIVGDALLAHAQRTQLEPGRPHTQAAAESAAATALMIEGQLEDSSLGSGGGQSTVTMEAHKTGALFACAGALEGAPRRRRRRPGRRAADVRAGARALLPGRG